ncbi:MAG TPA: endonuclease/exonuclease/phosphatase family protein [Pirellulales bacterium]|nr:endonuclease/exonuclease/phosphatase family protein [Pirellulales bacterium]
MKRGRWALAVLLAVLAVLLALAFCSERMSTGHEASSRRTSLRIVAFNTHLLPGIALQVAGHRGQAAYRAEAIGRRLADYDLAGLCEVFDAQRRDELIGGAATAAPRAFTSLWFPKPRGRSLTNSGLLLLSRLPIEASHLLTYRDASRFISHGFRADGFAAKGVLHARLRLGDAPGELLDCFLTHLESRSAPARKSQVEELARFIAAHASLERPAVLMGDLNIAADYPLRPNKQTAASPYQELLAALESTGLEWIDVWPSLQSDAGGTNEPLDVRGGRRIDYIFISAAQASARCSLRPTKVRVERFLDDKVKEGSLSDHAAVVCELEIQVR